LVVVESALSDISDRDREFLDAMAIEDGAGNDRGLDFLVGRL
jgi:hypothetical protein